MCGRCCVHDDQFIMCVSVTGEGKNGQANYIISVKIKAPVGTWRLSNMCTVKMILSSNKFKTTLFLEVFSILFAILRTLDVGSFVHLQNIY